MSECERTWMVRTTPEYFWLALELFYPYIQLLRVIPALNVFHEIQATVVKAFYMKIS